jgi:hypothetical protein
MTIDRQLESGATRDAANAGREEKINEGLAFLQD